ncbi:conserved hypothetical protein [Hyella patelloides LEGE 07179]|uniref:SnoaL-like domain-containing protein n=1 Tax=Hyella patelloides LEGE 07179 TaxID=945734 RepID=A0A563VNL8_9CYAN|nr:nuclear transport factor 2 family protein [Hyella patelloides]VEP12875.1 conserved hypothetical protein [Hyella patelloides LEGE 07179]
MASSSVLTKSNLDLVIEMEIAASQIASGKHDENYFKTFFLDDVFFKVGASKETRGYRNIIDYLIWLFSFIEPNWPFEFRGTWELEDTVIIEMDTKCFRRSDGKPISFPCTDILRFEGNKIREWRVYPDQSELWLTDKV